VSSPTSFLGKARGSSVNAVTVPEFLQQSTQRPVDHVQFAADEVVADTRDVFPPKAPEGLLVLREEGGNRLVWNPSLARDLAGYRLYAKDGGGEWRRLADALSDPAFYDAAAPAGRTYGVTAVDAAGNESPRGER